MEEAEAEIRDQGDESLLGGGALKDEFFIKESGEKWIVMKTNIYSIVALLASAICGVVSSILFLVSFICAFYTSSFTLLYFLFFCVVTGGAFLISIFEFLIVFIHSLNGLFGLILFKSTKERKKLLRTSQSLLLMSAMLNLLRMFYTFLCGLAAVILMALFITVAILGSVIGFDFIGFGSICAGAMFLVALSLRLTVQHVQMNSKWGEDDEDLLEGVEDMLPSINLDDLMVGNENEVLEKIEKEEIEKDKEEEETEEKNL